MGDSVGRRVGILWRPPAAELSVGRSIPFHIATPRDASLLLLNSLGVFLEMNSNFMRVSLDGPDPVRAANTLNVWTTEFVRTAAELKRRNLTEFSRILQEQLQYAGRQLRDAEIALEAFRVNTITLPAESGPIIPGLEATKGPVFTNFFDRKIEFDNVRQQRIALEAVLKDPSGGVPDALAIASIPNLDRGPGTQELSNALTELYAKEADLRAKSLGLTDEHQVVRALRQDITALRSQTIPRLALAVLAQLRQRETDLNSRIEAQGKDMRGIPTRTIEEMRLRREVSVSENLYTTLQNRYEEAKLAEASSVPDVTPLDMAAPTDAPSTNTKIRVLGIAIAMGFGLGIVFALLIDKLDHRFRYAEQVESTLRLAIIGAVPSLKRFRADKRPVQAEMVVEAFRGIRLRLQHARNPTEPIVCAITSAAPAEGKSMVSANLALSMAEAGYNTLLIDGDTRRGALNELFGALRRPGLIECLAGAAVVAECTRPTTHQRLSLLPAGARSRRNPEAIASADLPQLMATLRKQYDVIIVDENFR